jgi:hypothetical protein
VYCYPVCEDQKIVLPACAKARFDPARCRIDPGYLVEQHGGVPLAAQLHVRGDNSRWRKISSGGISRGATIASAAGGTDRGVEPVAIDAEKI